MTLALLLIWLGRSLLFASTMLHGPVFVPSRDEDIERMIALADIQTEDRIIDLGSGNGAILHALAERGITAEGIELNPLLVAESRKTLKAAGYGELITVHRGNFWDVDLSQYDVIFLYGTTYIMEKLERKLKEEMKPKARLISNYFELPNWKPVENDGKIRRYEPPSLEM